jgi:hypothetical protein
MKYLDFFNDILKEHAFDYQSVPKGDEGVDWFIAGKKPIVLIDKGSGSASGKYQLLIKHIKRYNLPYITFKGFNSSEETQLAVGRKGSETDLKKLNATFDKATGGEGPTEEFHRTVGKLLGYSQKDIDTFVHRRKNKILPPQ